MPNENGQRTINEIIRDDILYVRNRVDQINEKLDEKADKVELEKIKEKQDKLVSVKDGLYGGVLVASHWLANLFR